MRKIQLLFILIFLIILGGCFENSKKADLVLNIKWNNERVEDILDSKRIIPKATEKLEIKIYKGYSVIKDNIVHSNSINSSTNSYVIEELDTGPHTIEVNAVDERGHYYAYAIKKIELKSGDNTSKIVLKLNIILEVNINNKYFSHDGAYIVAPNDNISLKGETYYLWDNSEYEAEKSKNIEKVSFKSSNTSIADVDSSGKITVKGYGEFNIIATSEYDDTQTTTLKFLSKQPQAIIDNTITFDNGYSVFGFDDNWKIYSEEIDINSLKRGTVSTEGNKALKIFGYSTDNSSFPSDILLTHIVENGNRFICMYNEIKGKWDIINDFTMENINNKYILNGKLNEFGIYADIEYNLEIVADNINRIMYMDFTEYKIKYNYNISDYYDIKIVIDENSIYKDAIDEDGNINRNSGISEIKFKFSITEKSSGKNQLTEENIISTKEKLQEPIINLDDSIIFKYGEKFISIESYMQDVEIRYTLDGTEPTEESYLYSGEIIIDKNTVLKAKAFAVGYEESNTVTRNYKIRAMKPYASEDKDTYIDSIDIFLSSDDLDSTIYYTLDEDSVNDKSNEFKPTHLIKYS